MIIISILASLFILGLIFIREECKPTQDTEYCASIRAHVKQLMNKE